MEASKKHRRNLMILSLTMVVVMMGFGIIIPVMPFYIRNAGASGQQLGWLMASYSIAQFFFAPVFGKLSDQIGRKPVLIIGLAGNAVGLVLFGLATTYGLMLASRIFMGILSSATLPAMMAYISDSTTPENRSGGMGIINAAMGVGMILGPGIGGWLGKGSISSPFFLAAGISLAAILLVLAILPESLPVSRRSAKTRVRTSSISGMLKAVQGPLGFLFFLALLVNFGMAGFEGIFGLYAVQRYHYSPDQIGAVLTIMGLISALIQGLLTGRVTRRWGEMAVIKTSLIASAAAFVLLRIANSYAAVLATVGFFVLSNNMLRPSISSLISKGSVENQGTAMGMTNAYMSLGRIVGPLWGGFLFDVNLHLPYLSSAGVMAVGFALSLVFLNGRLSSWISQVLAQAKPAAQSD